VYEHPGSYTATLKVTDVGGAVDDDSIDIEVTAPEPTQSALPTASLPPLPGK
jgi:hypothetical protein